MIKTYTKKLIVIGLVIISIFTMGLVPVKAEWKKDNIGWWYKYENGYIKDSMREIHEDIYYFDEMGYMKTGWIKLGDYWYYFYDNGALAKNTSINGYVVGESGSWIEGITWEQEEYYRNLIINNVDLKEYIGPKDFYYNYLKGNNLQVVGLEKEHKNYNLNDFIIHDGILFHYFPTECQPIYCIVDREKNKVYTYAVEDNVDYWCEFKEWENKEIKKEYN